MDLQDNVFGALSGCPARETRLKSKLAVPGLQPRRKTWTAIVVGKGDALRLLPGSRENRGLAAGVEGIQGAEHPLQAFFPRALTLQWRDGVFLDPSMDWQHPDVANSLNNLAQLYETPRSSMRRPNLFTSGRGRSWKRPWARSTPT